MKPHRRWLLIAAAPLLLAAVWMDRQPSYKPYEAPLLTPPAESVSVTGQELVDPNILPSNPIEPDAASLARGAELYLINCSFCHGSEPGKPGPVGAKLQPPAPVLAQQRLQQLGDGGLFQRITFGVGRMPAFRQKLASQERWDLINYLRSRD